MLKPNSLISIRKALRCKSRLISHFICVCVVKCELASNPTGCTVWSMQAYDGIYLPQKSSQVHTAPPIVCHEAKAQKPNNCRCWSNNNLVLARAHSHAPHIHTKRKQIRIQYSNRWIFKWKSNGVQIMWIFQSPSITLFIVKKN